MENTVPLPDGRRFRVKKAGDQYAVEYLESREVGDTVTWAVTAVRPMHDKAMWVLWQMFLERQAPQE